MKRVLVIDDKVEALKVVLEEVLDGYEIVCAASGPEGLAALGEDIGAVLLDIRMPAELGDDPDREGLAVMREIARRRPGLPVIMFTSYGEVGLALEAGRLGAFDYVLKSDHPDKWVSVLDKAMAVEAEPPTTPRELDRFGALIGGSEPMRRVYMLIERLGPTNRTILIQGETGTGKDLVAKEIHRVSGRAREKFRAVNMTRIPAGVFESELFGHRKGAFTGATYDKPGEFELASGGTLFLDEIGELPLNLQAKLLRALEEDCVQRVGETQPRRVDVRIVAATKVNLLEEMKAGRFRDDLYYRLQRATIKLPPLRERGGDIVVLAEHFLRQVVASEELGPKRFSPEALEVMRRYPWPGNVRELKNAVEYAAVLTDGEVIGPNDLQLADAEVTVHQDLDKLFEDQKGGHTGVTTPREFKAQFGERALRHVLKRALEETGEQAKAGVLLGFLSPDHTEREYQSFRQWFRRTGLTSRDVLR